MWLHRMLPFSDVVAKNIVAAALFVAVVGGHVTASIRGSVALADTNADENSQTQTLTVLYCWF